MNRTVLFLLLFLSLIKLTCQQPCITNLGLKSLPPGYFTLDTLESFYYFAICQPTYCSDGRVCRESGFRTINYAQFVNNRPVLTTLQSINVPTRCSCQAPEEQQQCQRLPNYINLMQFGVISSYAYLDIGVCSGICRANEECRPSAVFPYSPLRNVRVNIIVECSCQQRVMKQY